MQNVSVGHETEESEAEVIWLRNPQEVPLNAVAYPVELTDSQKTVVTHETAVATPVANSRVVTDPVVVPESGTTDQGVRTKQ